MMAGVPERRTPNNVRYGTISLFAALNVASGFVIGKCDNRHQASDWTKSADEILDSVKRFCQKTQQTLCSEL